MSKILKSETIIGSDFQIEGDIYLPEQEGKLPLVLVMHGFKGFKDWGFFPYVCGRIADSGAICVIFNFTHAGITNPEKILFDVDSFAKNTITQELADAKHVLDNIKNGNIPGQFGFPGQWNGGIYLLGHSLGGGISILTASRESGINKLAVWASIAKFDRYSKRQKDEWIDQGYIEFENTETGQMLRMDANYIQDILDHKEEYSLPEAAAKLEIPFLIVHGQQDIVVPMREGEQIKRKAKDDLTEFHVIEKAGHVFGADHPFGETNDSLEEALDLTLKFFGLK